MAEISGLYLESDAIDSQVLSNNVTAKARNAADSANVDLYKLNTDDKMEFSAFPLTPSSAPSTNYQVANKKFVDDSVANYIPTSQKGQASGVAPLGADTKIASTYLPSYVDDVIEAANFAALPTVGAKATVVYDTVTFTAVNKGVAGNSIVLVFNGTDDIDTVVNAWNLAHPTNTVGFTGQAGTYVPSAGTATLINGVDTLAETGKIYITLDDNLEYRYSGTIYVQISKGPVDSVNSKTGAITLYTDDISEDGSPVNLWFTASRAKTAAVGDTIVDGVTDVAPSQNAVFDALAGKQATGNYITALTGEVTASGPGSASATVSNSAVIAKVLTGFTSGAGSITAADSLLSAVQKLDGNINAMAAVDPHEEEITLSGTNITNGYVDAAYELLPLTILVWPSNPCGPIQTRTTDWTHSVVGGKSRITWTGNFATKVLAGHKIMVHGIKV
jgi:hypothetical protein